MDVFIAMFSFLSALFCNIRVLTMKNDLILQTSFFEADCVSVNSIYIRRFFRQNTQVEVNTGCAQYETPHDLVLQEDLRSAPSLSSP